MKLLLIPLCFITVVSIILFRHFHLIFCLNKVVYGQGFRPSHNGTSSNGSLTNETQQNGTSTNKPSPPHNGTSTNGHRRNNTSPNRRQGYDNGRGPPKGIDSLFPKECRKSPKTDMKECCKIFPDMDLEKAKSCWGNISFNGSKSTNGTKFHNYKSNNSSFSTNTSNTTNSTKKYKFNRNNSSMSTNSSKSFGFIQGFCHSSDCMLRNFGYLKNGSFDAENAKIAIDEMKKDSAWTKEVIYDIFGYF